MRNDRGEIWLWADPESLAALLPVLCEVTQTTTRQVAGLAAPGLDLAAKAAKTDAKIKVIIIDWTLLIDFILL